MKVRTLYVCPSCGQADAKPAFAAPHVPAAPEVLGGVAAGVGLGVAAGPLEAAGVGLGVAAGLFGAAGVGLGVAAGLFGAAGVGLGVAAGLLGFTGGVFGGLLGVVGGSLAGVLPPPERARSSLIGRPEMVGAWASASNTRTPSDINVTRKCLLGLHSFTRLRSFGIAFELARVQASTTLASVLLHLQSMYSFSSPLKSVVVFAYASSFTRQ